MDFKFTEDQLSLQEMAREFAEKEIAPKAAELDEVSKHPADLFAKMAELGFTGLCTPEEYGGAGGGDIEKAIVIEEFARKDPAVAGVYAIHFGTAAFLNNWGSEELKREYLPKLANGALGAFAMTEPGAGSDASAMRTTAILDETAGEYVINGSKCFITGGSQADYIALIALTQPELGVKGMSAILIDTAKVKGKGFTIGKIEHKMGLHASETAELIFEDCRVPKENLIGVEGKGFNYAMTILDGSRIACGAQCVGLAEGAIELAVKYSKERVQFGKPISANQGIQWYLADMATRTEAAKWMTYHAAYLKASGQKHSKEAAMAKLFGSETARFVANLAMQIHGGYGYMEEYPMAKLYRDAKILEIWIGTSEVQKMVISRAVMG